MNCFIHAGDSKTGVLRDERGGEECYENKFKFSYRWILPYYYYLVYSNYVIFKIVFSL